MSPYRDYDLRSERKMRASVGRTASFMSTSTGSRPQPLGKIGITLVIQQNTMKLCIRIQKYVGTLLMYSLYFQEALR